MRPQPVALLVGILGVLGIFGPEAIHGMYTGSVSEKVTTYEPEYFGWKEFRAAIRSEPARAIAKRGKIHVQGTRLFVNEPNQGVHVFDNADPEHPRAVAFLRIPGNLDLAVKGDVLFADSFVDLVALDIGALPEIRELNRQVDVFPYDAFQVADGEPVYTTSTIDRNRGVVVAWKAVRRPK